MMIQSVERKITALTAKLEEMRQLRSIAGMEQWQHLRKAVEGRILAHINQLCQDIDDGETRSLRAEVRALRWFLRIPMVNEKDMETTAEQVAGLRKKLERLHTLGVGQSAEVATVGAEADAINSKLEGTP